MSKNIEGYRSRRARRVQSALVMVAAAALTALAAPGIASEVGALGRPLPPIRAQGERIADPLPVQVAPAVVQRLKSGGRGDFVIEFRERPDLSAAASMDWIDRGRYVHRTLVQSAERSQAAVRDALLDSGAEVESFWIKNVLWVRNGDLAAVQTAARFSQVQRIIDPPRVNPVDPVRKAAGADVRAGIGDNIAQVGADRVWAQGTLGSGISVGVIDDGALYTHEAIIRQYRGNLGGGVFEHDYNWLGLSSEPTALESAHGTHVVGTIVGDDHDPDPAQRNRIGMAPGARWMMCNSQPDFIDPMVALLTCGQFMLAPTRLDGEAPDPDRRPHVVNNSWSEGNCNGTATDFYRDLVDAWVAAGMFPAFAVGNTTTCGFPEPPGLSTLSSPAALGASFAVGSTGNHDGHYAPHSLWGPTDDPAPGLPHHPDHRGHPHLKPQVVAPGVAIRSAMIEDGESYGTMTGTSMSTPHVSGLVALMLDAGPCLVGDYAGIGGLIMQTARPVPYASGGQPPPGLGNLPNYATGWGEIDAPAAVNAAAAACGPSGFLRGVVTDKQGSPIAGARVDMSASASGPSHETTTAADGSYIRRLPVDGGAGYLVRVSAYGYLAASEPGVRIYDGQATPLDVSLPAAPMHSIQGRITDAATGWPLHARIAIVGSSLAPVWSDPVSGRYSVRLPEGAPFRFDVSTEIAGYRPRSIDLPSVGSAATLDIGLEADEVACIAPGYGFTGEVFAESFDSGMIPAGWSASSAGLGWLFGTADDVSTPSFPVPERGLFAASNDQLGPDGGESNDGRYDYLVLPSQDLVGRDRPVLSYRSFQTYDTTEGVPRPPAAVEASTDGGQTWVVVGAPTPTSATAGWTLDAADLSPVIGPDVLIRFHADDLGDKGWGFLGSGWAIDDVAIRTGCTPPVKGGLVVGRVRDANTLVALDGVDVQAASGASVRTRTSADPGVGVGFFAVFAQGPADMITARPGADMPVEYGDAGATAPVADGETVSIDLALPAGRLRIYPTGPAATLELGTTTTTSFTAANTGTLPLSFGFEGVVIEEHFESAFPPAGWTVTSAGADCPWQWLDPLQLANHAGGDGLAAAVDLYPCEGLGDIDTALVSPTFDLAGSSTASVGFMLSLLDGAEAYPRLDVEATVDGGATWNPVFSETRDNNGTGPGALIEADLSPFAGSQAVQVRFRFRATPPWGWIIIDQVHLFGTINGTPMLDLTPDAAMLPPGQSVTVQATFDARTVTQPGVYRESIRVAEDTPYPFPFGGMEAVMTVTPPASHGSVAGTIRGLGRCDADIAPIAGAVITIQDGAGNIATTASDDDGHYRYWLDAATGPFTLTVDAPGHLPEIVEVALAAGEETARDIDLRLLAPCLAVDPALIEGTVSPGQGVGRGVDLLNGGPVATQWTLRAGGDPNVLTPVPVTQTVSPTPEQFVSFACINPETGFTLENRYFRIFPMAGRSVAGSSSQVHGITFGVDSAFSLDGSQPVAVRLHRLDGALALGNLTQLAEQTVDVSDSTLTRISVAFDGPVAVDADAVLVAELYVPDGDAGNIFFPGGNSAGELAPAYHAAMDCDWPDPIALPDQGLGFIHLILELDVLGSDPCGAAATPVPWLSFEPGTGSIEGDAIRPLTALFAASQGPSGVQAGAACLADGEDPSDWTVIPARMHVTDDADRVFANGFE